MSTYDRISSVFDIAEEIPFDDSSKFTLFSDCHRGDNSWADDFSHNQMLYFHALEHYLAEGFTYIELGDGDELWENLRFADIRRAHSHIFWLLRQFYLDNRLFMLWGNHDMERQDQSVVERTLYTYFDEREKVNKPLLFGIKLHEGLVLKHTGTGERILLIHGHQADPLNDRFWKFGRFMVRAFWRHLQIIGVTENELSIQYETKWGISENTLSYLATKYEVDLKGVFMEVMKSLKKNGDFFSLV